MVATHRTIDFSGSSIRDHLQYIFARTRGYVSLALLDRNKPGSAPRETFFHWPDQQDELIAAVDVARNLEGVEVFYCPYPMKTPERLGANSSILRVVHTDVDSGLTAQHKKELISWGFRLVRSGSDGNYHVYGRLSRAVSLEQHRGILEALRAKLSGDNKIADNDLLRVPETTNWKNLHPDPAKRNNEPLPVKVEVEGKRQIDVDGLVAWLGAKQVVVRSRIKEAWDKVDVSEIDSDLLKLARMSVTRACEVFGNRHQAVWAITRDLARAGLTPDQIHTLMDDFPAALDKADDERGYKVHRDVERALIDFDLVEGKELAIINPDDEDWADTNFWSRRPTLKHIRDYAYASTANPWGTLGVVLLRVLYNTPNNVLMPGQNDGKTGTRALNMFVTLIGVSGAGKKTATDAATHAFDMGIQGQYLPIGSGEGIAKSYRRRGKGKDEPDMVIKNTRIIFEVAEVSTWNNLVGRQGATLIGEVLKAFSGEALGFSNSDEERTIHVEANSYRMCLILGAQPGTTRKLLAEQTSGLPQRFLWMPTEVNKSKWDLDNMPKPPETQEWIGPEWNGNKEYVLKYPNESRRDRAESRFASGEGGDLMESQAIVIKMRVAAALGLLDGRSYVSDEDWALAGIVMLQSRRTRQRVMEYLADVNRREAAMKGKSQAITKLAEEAQIEKIVEGSVRRVADFITKKLDDADGRSMTKGKLNQAVASRDRKHIEGAIAWLIEEGKISKRNTTDGGRTTVRYRLRGEG